MNLPNVNHMVNGTTVPIVNGEVVSFTEDFSFIQTLGPLTLLLDIQTMHTRQRAISRSWSLSVFWQFKDGKHGRPAARSSVYDREGEGYEAP